MAKPASIFDGRNITDLAKLKALGFRVYGIGKPAA
jgi:UDPglucose 6-dehydrogenase